MNEPNKQINRFTFVLILIATCFVSVESAQGSEPSYKGQPLSEWLLVLKLQQLSGNHEDEIPAGMEQPEDAIRQIGTNAIPALLDILGATDKNKWRMLAKLKSRDFREQFLHRDTNLNDLRGVAVDAFGILGTNAVSAIPQIKKLFRDWETCSEAGQTLAELGPEGIAVLTNGLSDENADIRGMTIWVIGEKAPMDSNTIARLMIGCLKDPQNGGAAARYLAGKDPALAIPALLPLLDDDSTIPSASRALSSYGAMAEVAIPKLLSIYTNKIVESDRQSAKYWGVELMWAIKPIDMDAAAKAEAFLVNSGPLNYAREGYTTTLLPSGKELIAGGYIHTEIPKIVNRTIASAELIDPATGKWTETGVMNFARYDHQAVLQPDGKVLVTGGYDTRYGDTISSEELYDPATETWIVITNK